MVYGLLTLLVLLGGGGGRAEVKFPEKSVTKVYGSTLLALRGGVVGVRGVSNFREKTFCSS